MIERKPYEVMKLTIKNYELQGCLPVPLLEGISAPYEYMRSLDIKPFLEFILLYKPDVVHFHTIMGIPRNYLEELKARGIKTVFTSHDYYGICPRVTLIRGKNNCSDYDCEKCADCNKDATSIKKVRILQSGLYRTLKDTAIIKVLRKKHRKQNELSVGVCEEAPFYSTQSVSKEYVNLRKYYLSMLELFDIIHFNSNNTKKIYCSYSDKIRGKVLNISHCDISDHRKKRTRHSICHLTYLGPETYHKGYYLLLAVCDELWKKGYKFIVNIYFQPETEKPYIEPHKPYNYKELSAIMDDSDYVLVPSLWNETYGFTVAEAMSYGVPVIVSNTVGAKDEIEDEINGVITKATTSSFYHVLKNVIDNPSIFDKYNTNICKGRPPRTMIMHCQDILKLYK